MLDGFAELLDKPERAEKLVRAPLEELELGPLSVEEDLWRPLWLPEDASAVEGLLPSDELLPI